MNNDERIEVTEEEKKQIEWESLHMSPAWDWYMKGVLHTILAMQEHFPVKNAYDKAFWDMLSKSRSIREAFVLGNYDQIRYRNHKYKKNAKKDSNGEWKVKDLESVEAYLARHTNIVTEVR